MAAGWRKEYFRYKGFFLNVYDVYESREDLKIFLELVLSLVTVSLLTVFALKPTFLTISQLMKDISSKEDVVTKMDQKIANLKTAQNLLIQEGPRLDLIKGAVPENPVAEYFTEQIQGLGNFHSVEIRSLSVEQVVLTGEEKKTVNKNEAVFSNDAKGLSFSFSLTGEYQALYNFIQDLGKLRRPIQIDTLTITSAQKDTGKVITLVIAGRTPYLRLNQTK